MIDRLALCFALTIFGTGYLRADEPSKSTKEDVKKDERVYLSSPDKPKAKPKTQRYKPAPKAEDFSAPTVLKKSTAPAEAKTPPEKDGADDAEPTSSDQ